MDTQILFVMIMSFFVGMWVGGIIIYTLMVRPLSKEISDLMNEMHQQIKIGFYKEQELKKEEHE
jgi:uncharacterized membrane protein